MLIGTFVAVHLAISKTEILLRVLEERLDAPALRIRANQVFGRGVDLVRNEVLDRVVLVLVVRFFLGDHELHVIEFRHRQFLRPDVIELALDLPFSRVDALVVLKIIFECLGIGLSMRQRSSRSV